MAEAPVDLSAFKNKTVLQPTGEAQTTMVNKTTVPFEQTTVEGMNQTQGQQQSGQVQQQQQQKQGNKSSGPLEKIGETITGAFK